MNREPQIISVAVPTDTPTLRGVCHRWAVRGVAGAYERPSAFGWVPVPEEPVGFRVNGSPEVEILNRDDLRAMYMLLDRISEAFDEDDRGGPEDSDDNEEPDTEEGIV